MCFIPAKLCNVHLGSERRLEKFKHVQFFGIPPSVASIVEEYV